MRVFVTFSNPENFTPFFYSGEVVQSIYPWRLNARSVQKLALHTQHKPSPLFVYTLFIYHESSSHIVKVNTLLLLWRRRRCRKTYMVSTTVNSRYLLLRRMGGYFERLFPPENVYILLTLSIYYLFKVLICL